MGPSYPRRRRRTTTGPRFAERQRLQQATRRVARADRWRRSGRFATARMAGEYCRRRATRRPSAGPVRRGSAGSRAVAGRRGGRGAGRAERGRARRGGRRPRRSGRLPGAAGGPRRARHRRRLRRLRRAALPRVEPAAGQPAAAARRGPDAPARARLRPRPGALRHAGSTAGATRTRCCPTPEHRPAPRPENAPPVRRRGVLGLGSAGGGRYLAAGDRVRRRARRLAPAVRSSGRIGEVSGAPRWCPERSPSRTRARQDHRRLRGRQRLGRRPGSGLVPRVVVARVGRPSCRPDGACAGSAAG